MHNPRDDHFSLLLYISMQHRASHPLRADAANRRRPDRLHFLSPQRVSPKVCAHVAWADGHHMNSEVLQFHSRRFAECIHGKFGRAVHSVEGKRDMPGNAGYINNCSRALLLHDWDNCQHGFNSTEEVGIECLATGCHVQLRD